MAEHIRQSIKPPKYKEYLTAKYGRERVCTTSETFVSSADAQTMITIYIHTQMVSKRSPATHDISGHWNLSDMWRQETNEHT